MTTATLKNIEQGIHLMWPTEWLAETLRDIDNALATGAEEDRAERLIDCRKAVEAELINRRDA